MLSRSVMEPVVPLQEAPVTELMREAIADARELVRLEVELAVREARDDLRSFEHAAIGFAFAAAAAVASLSLFAVAAVLALGAKQWIAAVIAGALLAFALAAAAVSWGALPKRPLERSRERVATDVQQIKENLA